MMGKESLALRHADRPAACGAFVGGLSLEELTLARAALALRAELGAARSSGAPEAELAALEQRAAELAAERRRAWQRKMIALGHIPAGEREE